MREPLWLPELPSDLPDPLASAIRAMDLDAIWSAISALPRRQRRVLVLREVGGLSYRELGRALGVSSSWVESLLFRARQHLRSLLTSANAAALPLAVREELERLIPGFDPGSAAFVARITALPVTAKLASAALGVGVVATGAAHVPEHRARPTDKQAATVNVPAVQPAHVTGTRPVVDRRALLSGPETHAERRSGGVEPPEPERETARVVAEHEASDGLEPPPSTSGSGSEESSSDDRPPVADSNAEDTDD